MRDPSAGPASGVDATGWVPVEQRAHALDAMCDAAFLMHPVRGGDGAVTDLEYRYVNDAGLALYRRPREEILGHTQFELFPSIRGSALFAAYLDTLQTGTASSLQVPWFDESGVEGAFILEFTVVDGDLLIVAHDITRTTRAEHALAEQTERLRAILDGTLDGVGLYGPDLRFEYVNRRVEELSGLPADRWIGSTHADLGFPAEQSEAWESHIRRVFETGVPTSFTYDTVNTEGHTWWEASLAPEFAPDGSVAHVLSTNREVTARVEAERRLQELATHDPLTGLTNRSGLLADIGRALKAESRTGRPVALLMVDLDRFKFVNDSRGHAAGDRLLCAAADRLVSVARGGDLVSRPGGDEFVIVMRDLDSPGDAVSTAWRLVEDFRAPFSTSDGELFATVSIGVAVAAAGQTEEDLLRDVDAALYAAKAAGRDRVWVFNDDLRAAASARLKLEGELRRALERGELEVWYQPEVDLTTGRLTAAEALLRWRHPDGLLLPAERFIGVAEETGLILPIGRWVFRQACDDAVHWARDLGRPIVVRINLSALQLEEAGFLPAVDAAIDESGVAPAQICAEITESVWLHGTDAVRYNLDGLRDRGMAVAIDDFGTGFASLTYLRQYPVSVLKIDRSFVTDIATDEADERLVTGLVALASAVGVQVAAEGVENQSQARVLRELGCPTAQGFLYSQAVPAAQLELLLDVTFPHG